MTDHDDQLDPIARLRDADPAVDVEPRAGFAEEVVAAAVAPEAEASAPSEAPVADLAAERARRRPRWLPIAAAAAAIAIVGGGAGYWAGASTGGVSVVAGGAAPPITLESGAGAPGAQPSIGDGASGGMDEQSKMMAGGASDLMYPYGFGRYDFHASGLATEAGSALAYTFDARPVTNAESVAALAGALGLDGVPELKDGSWTVGAQDGTGPSLWVGLDGTASFSYSDPRVNPWKCSADGATCEPSGALPGEAAAIEALRSLITASGRDAGDFEFTAETWEGAVTSSAQAWPVVDGQRLDRGWSVELAADGVVSASGALAAVVELGEYPVVSEQEGFERLSDPRFGAQNLVMPLAAREGGAIATDATSEEVWTPPTEAPAPAAPGAAIGWPVTDVEIVGARLGLASQWQPDGSVIVVPAYEFTDSDGGTWSVIAVAESKLDFGTD